MADESGPRLFDEWGRVDSALVRVIKAAVAAERERCAKIAESCAGQDDTEPQFGVAEYIAAEIRKG